MKDSTLIICTIIMVVGGMFAGCTNSHKDIPKQEKLNPALAVGSASLEKHSIEKHTKPVVATTSMSNLDMMFDNVCALVDTFSTAHHNRGSWEGFFWVSKRREDANFPHIRLAPSLGGRSVVGQEVYWTDKALIMERRPQPFDGRVIGYMIRKKQSEDGKFSYWVFGDDFVEGKKTKEDSVQITTFVQMTEAVRPFYERLDQAQAVLHSKERPTITKKIIRIGKSSG